MSLADRLERMMRTSVRLDKGNKMIEVTQDQYIHMVRKLTDDASAGLPDEERMKMKEVIIFSLMGLVEVV